MKSKTLPTLVLAGALAANSAFAQAQPNQMITEPDKNRIVQEYYYMPGVSGIYGYKDKDGTVIILQPQAQPSNAISSNYSVGTMPAISEGLGTFYTWFGNGPDEFIKQEKQFMGGLESLMKDILSLPETKQGYVKNGKFDKNYYKSREYLFDTIDLFYKAQSIKPLEGDLLTMKSAEAYLDNDFYLNADVLENSSLDVFRAYEEMANYYYKLAVHYPEGSDEQKKYAALCVEHAYEIPAKRFGEEKWLSLMGKEQNDYLGSVGSCYSRAGMKFSYKFQTTAKRVAFGK
jgi:hypothetical protein